MTNISKFDVIEELAQFLRNQDVLTTTVRGVTTTTENGTFASDSTHLIADTQIKNIRSITRGTLLALGTDYTYDTDFDDSGTKKTKITFTSAQTGSYTATLGYEEIERLSFGKSGCILSVPVS